jgi:hypothetical protein
LALGEAADDLDPENILVSPLEDDWGGEEEHRGGGQEKGEGQHVGEGADSKEEKAD